MEEALQLLGDVQYAYTEVRRIVVCGISLSWEICRIIKSQLRENKKHITNQIKCKKNFTGKYDIRKTPSKSHNQTQREATPPNAN